MNLIERLVTSRFAAKPRIRTREVAGEIAERSRTFVLERVGDVPRTMDRFEARGYVWARAALPVHRELDTLLAQHRDVGSVLRGTLLRMATEQVVNLVLDDLRDTPIDASTRRRAG